MPAQKTAPMAAITWLGVGVGSGSGLGLGLGSGLRLGLGLGLGAAAVTADTAVGARRLSSARKTGWG